MIKYRTFSSGIIASGAVGLVFLSLISGCTESRVEEEKRIVAYDHSFRAKLDERDRMEEDLNAKRTFFQKKENEISGRINALKEERTRLKNSYLAAVEKIKQRIMPEKKRLQQDLLDLKQAYNGKSLEFRGIEKNIKEISGLISKKDELILTREEIQTWNAKLSSLIETKAILGSEIDKLKTERKMMKLKIKVLEIR